MSEPSSPSPSSGDDFAALLDDELQSTPDQSNAGSEYDENVNVDRDGEEEEEEEEEEANDETADDAEGLGSQVREEAGEDSEVQEDGKEAEDDEDGANDNEKSELSAKLGFAQGKRKREGEEDDEAPLPAALMSGAKGSECPPHPGFMWGVCIRCGENRQVSNNSEPKPAAVSLRYIHEGLEVSEREAARMRRDELKHVMLKQKLYLVLDLDHTMLNSARFIEVYPEEEAHLAACYSTGQRLGEGEQPQFISGLHRLNQLQMWTKLRPFAHEFIEAASKICEMYVYTMGERAYAVAMVRLLDPTGRFFGDRIISQGDSTRSTMKDLDVVLGAESAVVIMDDTEGVWPKHRANLVLMERYHFFRSSCRQFLSRHSSLTESSRDESAKEGALATALKTLHRVHQTVFSAANSIERGISRKSRDYVDVRGVIQSLRGSILSECRVVFSRIFPTGMPYPEAHPFWRLTAELGAHCSTTTSAATTHVIALDRGTDKARWAKQQGKFLVHPSWVEAAQYLWCRPREEDFVVGEPPRSPLAKTVGVMSQIKLEVQVNGGGEGSLTPVPPVIAAAQPVIAAVSPVIAAVPPVMAPVPPVMAPVPPVMAPVPPVMAPVPPVIVKVSAENVTEDVNSHK